MPSHDEVAEYEKITKTRLQNPYAFLDDSLPSQAEVVSNVPQRTTSEDSSQSIDSQKKYRYSDDEIENQARNLQKRIWRDRKQIWPDAISLNPIKMLDPVIALQLIGYDCHFEETLGQFYSGGKLIEVAGTLDKCSKRVSISRGFSHNIRSFTAAHELGHALLHEAAGLHRDRPLDGAATSRDGVEFEADKFATFFLMPRNLVKTTFERFFLTDRFLLNDETAFALGLCDLVAAQKKCKTLRQLSRLLASAEHYNGLRFNSLASQFQVSTEAMAIRLEELGLVAL